jgi:hypothetical protein
MLRFLPSLWKSKSNSARKNSKRKRLLIDGLEPRLMFAGDTDSNNDDTVVTSGVASTSASASASTSALVQSVNTTNIDMAIEAGIYHLQRILDGDNANIPFFWVWALTRDQAAQFGDSSQHWRPAEAHLGFDRHLVSNIAGRATYALLLGAEAIDANLNSYVLNEYEKYVLKSLHKPRNGNWNDLSPANQMVTGLASDPRYYRSQQFDMTHLFNMGAGLRGALGMATLADDATEVQPGYLWSSKHVFEVSVYNIRKYYVYGGGDIGGSRVYNWEVFRNQLGLQGGDAWTNNINTEIDPNWNDKYVGWANPFLLYDLVKYYEATGHQSSLALALELRDYAFYQAFPRNASQVSSFSGKHGFEIAAEMNAYSRLALVTGDTDMMERVRVRYETLRGTVFSTTGWFPEYIGANRDVGEINNTAELIETALNFAEFGWTEYYQDVERFTRGHLLPAQLLDTSFVVPNPNPANDGQRNIEQRVFGAFGFPAPYGHVPTKNPLNTGAYHADVTAGAVSTLAEVKKAIHHYENGVHKVNLLFDFEDSQIKIASPYTALERVTITTKVAGGVRLQLPSWANRTEIASSLAQQGLQYEISSDSVLIHSPQVGRSFHVTMSLPFVRATDRVNGRNITIDWRGDSVYAMSTMGTPMPFFDNVSSTPPTSTPVNLPPTVNAGADKSAILGVALALSGTATDDGLPTSPGSLALTWSKVSGPGSVTFSNTNSASTNVQFGAAGQYVLRLTAFDGQYSRSDDVAITVTDPVQPVTVSFQDGVFPSIDYAGTRDTRISSTAPYTTHGTIADLTVDGTPPMAALMAWNISLIPQGSTILSAAIELFATNTTKDSYEVYALERAWEELAATWYQASSGVNWSSPGAAGSADAANTVLGSFTAPKQGHQQFALNQAGLALVQAWIDDPAHNFGIILKDYVDGDDNTVISSRESTMAANRPRLIVSYLPGNEASDPVEQPENQSPQVNAGANQTIQLPNSASLQGTATDDGLPDDPVSLTTTWTKVSGPGTVTFGNANALNTTASFSAAGTYILRLTASDGELESIDDVTIVVQPAPVVNQPPVVNAGPDQTIQLPSSATLNGVVTDDGLPASPGEVGTAWSKVSGPGTVTFGNAGNLNTTATFSAAGIYILRLAANDGQYQVVDDVTIVVQPAPIVNQPPVVNAGPDQTIQLPGSATLTGVVTDDGQPASPGAVTTTWSKASGPGAVTFGNANNRNTTASFSAAGTYVLRLTASDGHLQRSDDLTIIVIPPLVQHQPPIVSVGPDFQADLKGDTNLVGTVTFTTPARPITAIWTLTLGPAAVRFDNPTSLNTEVKFDREGTYIIRLTVSDGEFTVFDEVTITVDKKGDGDSKKK